MIVNYGWDQCLAAIPRRAARYTGIAYPKNGLHHDGRPNSVTPAAAFARYPKRAPGTVTFIRRAAPAFLRQISKEYSRETLPAPNHPDPKTWPNQGLHATWLGHSTTLLKLDGFTILTDPVF